ncbi:MAG: helix-turn-helix domain-containing protein [Rikenellaceae bacterium]
MKIEDVPQDGEILQSTIVRDVCYALDDNGNYKEVISVGWEAKNEANNFAWSAINEESERIKEEVVAGKLSPLSYHLSRQVMTTEILAKYTGFSRREISKFCHKPDIFFKLCYDDLHKLATALNISVEQLISID